MPFFVNTRSRVTLRRLLEADNVVEPMAWAVFACAKNAWLSLDCRHDASQQDFVQALYLHVQGFAGFEDRLD